MYKEGCKQTENKTKSEKIYIRCCNCHGKTEHKVLTSIDTVAENDETKVGYYMLWRDD